MTNATWIGLIALAAAPLSAAEVDFSHDIVPVLQRHCGQCHAGDAQNGGLSLNTRQSLLAGGESGPVVVIGSSDQSELVARMATDDDSLRMPPEGARVPPEQIALVKRWIDEGLGWEAGFTFGQRAYEPPLRPRRVELPPPIDGRQHPLDRLLDAYSAERQLSPRMPIDDAAFARRAYLDIIGLLPEPDELQAFLADAGSDKRARLVRGLLDRDVDYAEHWLSFWNDLLRNDYTGTGFITGGRRQITKWLYAALVANMPYDRFARELIAPPTPESAGYGQGIRWRGDVSAGQTVEIQFAQSVGQTFLGINLKCASCHDSFVDRWKLEDAFGLAAIFATQPLELHRCDKPLGKVATASWLFPELGQVDPQAPQPERLEQLAALMTHPENGRFTRTIVNRLWHRMMGRGIVHPTDAMQSEPWNADLLDYLAVYLADQQYDLKRIIELIATSQAYQSPMELETQDSDDQEYVYAGPRAKRLTAEQFIDCVWQLGDSGPASFDAPVQRGPQGPAAAGDAAAGGKMVRASLVKSDFLMRSLGRPNRDQIVSVRPNELTTLEAIDLANGQILADTLERSAARLLARSWDSPQAFVHWLYRFALSREPQAEEREALVETVGNPLSKQGVQDALWAVVMLPEFQFVK